MKRRNIVLAAIPFIFGLITFISPLLVSAAIGDVPSYGLVGHWQFDTSTGTTTDASGNGYTATMGNNPTVVAGVAGDALQFATTTGNNNNYVGFPASLQYANFPQSGSLSFWIKGTFSTQASGRYIFDGFAGRNHFYVQTYTSGRLQINLQDSSTNYLNQISQQVISDPSGAYSNFSISDGAWTHFVIEWDTTNKIGRIYENSALQYSFFYGSYNPTWTPVNQKFQFNATSSGASTAETLDDVALYNRPLTAAEVSAIYNGSAAPLADTSAPSMPTDPGANSFSSTKITLGWSASTDDAGVSGYIIYRNGSPVGYASSTALSYLDTYLTPNTGYTYTVRAFDAAGNQSADSVPVTVTTTGTKMLMNESFEEDNTEITAGVAGWLQSGPNDDAIVVTTERARAGSKAVKYSFDYSDWQIGDTNNHQRAEIGESTTTNLTLGQTYWLGISEYLPANWVTDNFANGELIWQLHGSSNGPAFNNSPPIALYIDGPEVYLTVHGATTTSYSSGQSLPTAHLATFSLDDLKGKWTDWVLQLNVNYTGGFINAWKNGVKVASYTGPTIYHSVSQTTEIGPKLQIGTYKWGWGSSATLVSNRALYADELRIADNTASCSDVSPSDAAPCSAGQEVFTATGTSPAVNLIALVSNEASSSMARVGDTVTLSFSVEQAPRVTPVMSINGRSVPAIAGAHYTDAYGTDRYPYSASTTIQGSDAEGPMSISATVGNYNGQGTTTINQLLYGPNVTIDKTPPVITLTGGTNTGYVGSGYADPGATAVDSHDGALAVTSESTINSSVPGTYQITYTATDAAGNSASAIRTVVVKQVGNGPIVGSVSAPLPITRPQIMYPDGTRVYLDAASSTPGTPPPAASLSGIAPISLLRPVAAAPVSSNATARFTRNLQLRDRSADVRALQQFLNGNGFPVAAAGPGSPGHETTTFGVGTYRALKKFQAAHGLPATGYFGPQTRALVNAFSTQ